jgi:hypothetical protein
MVGPAGVSLTPAGFWRRYSSRMGFESFVLSEEEAWRVVVVVLRREGLVWTRRGFGLL